MTNFCLTLILITSKISTYISWKFLMNRCNWITYYEINFSFEYLPRVLYLSKQEILSRKNLNKNALIITKSKIAFMPFIRKMEIPIQSNQYLFPIMWRII